MVVGFMEQVLTKEGEPTNHELVTFMQTALGYSLTGHTGEEKVFYLYGKLGRNGKGSITEALQALMPYPLSAEIPFETLTMKREASAQNHDLAALKPSRLVFASESNRYQSLNPGTIKSLSGGNHVTCAHKFKDFFDYQPQFKPWLSSNHPVNGDPDDSAMWARVLIITCPNSYIGREDKKLKARMKSPEGQRGLLAWIAEGAKRWYKEGLRVPDQVKLATKKQRTEQDTFSEWVGDAIEQAEGAFTPYAESYQNYKLWCEANGVTPKQQRQFTDAMVTRGYVTKPKRIGSRVVKGYEGVRLAEEYTPDFVNNKKLERRVTAKAKDDDQLQATFQALADDDEDDFDDDLDDI